MEQLEQEQQQEQEIQTEVIEQDAAQQFEQTEPVPEVQQETQPAEDIETLKKRLADTQAWAHERNQRAIELEREREAARLRQLQSGLEPGVLDVVDQAITVREIQARQAQEKRQQEVRDAVYEAVPDFESLNTHPAFAKALDEQAQALMAQGKDPMKPTLAVRAVLEAKRQFEVGQARAAAEAADKARNASKIAAMQMPGSGSASPATTKTPQQQADEVWNMSPEDFQKAKRKALGF